MSGAMRRVAPIMLAGALGAALVLLYRQHRREAATEAGRDAPVVAPSRVRDQHGTAVVTLDSAERRRIGLEVAALQPITGTPEASLPAEVVVETERATVLRTPVAGRFTLPTGAHWPGLGERVAAGMPIARISDARPLASAISGIVTRVGAQPGAIVEAGQALLEVADYSHPLVRVAWLESAGEAPRPRISLSPDQGATRVTARLVGPAPEADAVTRRPAYLFRAERTWPGATPGTPVTALVPVFGRSTAGVLVPDAAVVQWEGLAWAYRRRAPDSFERVRVPTLRPAPGGWIAGPPLALGDTIVVRGAQELLSEEFRARVTVGDESGE